VYGSLFAIMTLLKGLPMTYNRDLQEDKEPLFDAVDTVKSCLDIFSEMIQQTKFNVRKLYTAAQGSFSTATDLAEYLVKKGIPFRQAHGIVGKIVTYCLKNKKELSQLTIKEYQHFSRSFTADIKEHIQLEKAVNSRRHEGGTAKAEVLKRIREIEKGSPS
jgi:argininosuccinate lyase